MERNVLPRWGDMSISRSFLGLLVAALLAAPSCCDSEPGSTTFRIVNVGDRTLYLQAYGISGSQEFLALARDGVGISIEDSCGICNCSDCPSCDMCGRGRAAVRALAPGEVQELSWDGHAWVTEDSCDEQSGCERPHRVSNGTLDAAVTYSDSSSATTALGMEDELIGPPLTVSRSYRHPTDEVTFEVR
jgi:hypothetical protein